MTPIKHSFPSLGLSIAKDKYQYQSMEVITKTLAPRDPAPLFALPNYDGKNVILRDQAGKPVLLFFYAKNEIAACEQLLLELRDRLSEFTALNTLVLAISLDSPTEHQQFAQQHRITFALLADHQAKVSQEYGVCYQEIQQDQPSLIYTRSFFLLDFNQQIANIFTQANCQNQVQAALDHIRNHLAPQPLVHVQMQAPVLLIPNVFSPEFCRHLINVWETQGHGDSGFMKREGNKTVGYIDHTFKTREDHFVKDEGLKANLDYFMKRRVFPQIKKAFEFDVTRREDYKIASYTSENGGFFRAHRDNTTGGTAHRKFAMTLNLNTEEYEGGYLRFPEYGPYQYRPDTGSAVIFNCSLLHEATDVIKGRRFVLLCFFYGEAEAEARRQYELAAQNDYSQVVMKTAS
ncbi:MAG: redoxin domain-containing protein [Pseudanabaenaceae cyanobacterium bins.68]|nr:redoxin domain-containing protein [Pseudanabaenaceae cyanobacterium bins.68]